MTEYGRIHTDGSRSGGQPVDKDEDLWSDEICALVDAAFETVSRNPSDHEEAIAYRRAIAAALRQPTQSDALRCALQTARDYVADVAEGNIHFNDNIKAMAAEDLTLIDAALQEQSE